MEQLKYSYKGGIALNAEEAKYLLPHFLMLIIGKPGSGKTVLMRQMIQNPKMYKGKFDEILIVSPSYAKMGIELDERCASPVFSLDWIFDHIERISEKQEENVFGHSYGGVRKGEDRFDLVNGKRQTNTALAGDERSRFLMLPMLKSLGVTGNYSKTAGSTLLGHSIGAAAANAIKSQQQTEESRMKEQFEEYRQQMLKMQTMYKDIENMDEKKRAESHVNVLLVLDDVASSIKKAEFDPRLSQLVMNRRHLIPNGTISIMMVAQKYTLIPARVRSNANWTVLFNRCSTAAKVRMGRPTRTHIWKVGTK